MLRVLFRNMNWFLSRQNRVCRDSPLRGKGGNHRQKVVVTKMTEFEAFNDISGGAKDGTTLEDYKVEVMPSDSISSS